MSYLYLVILWLVFGLSHSLLAAEGWKRWVQQKTGIYFRYYRLLYSFIALALLVVILWYHWQLPVAWLWQPPVWLQVAGGVLALAGLYIMGLCIRRYFYDLSGIAVFFPGKASPLPLQQKGLHGFVRHPLYFGTLLTVWAFFVVFPLKGYLISCILMTVYTCIGAVLEEQKLRQMYGEAYRMYQEKVPMWWVRF